MAGPAPQGIRGREALMVSLTADSGGQVIRPCPADLVISAVAPGGYEALTCTISWPPGWPPGDAFSLGSIAQVVDRRSGEVVWHGQIVDPGTRRSMTISSQQISAQGFSRRLTLNGGPVAYVDRRLDMWQAGPSFASGQTQVTADSALLGQHPGDWVEPSTSVLLQTVPQGSKIGSGVAMYATYVHPRFSSNSQDIVMVLYSVDGIGVTGGPWTASIRIWTQSKATSNTPLSASYDAIASELHGYVFEGAGAWTMVNARQADVLFTYTGTLGDPWEATRDWWAKWGTLAVVFRRLDRTGAAAYSTTTYITVGDVIDDVIGRWLKDDFDITNAIASPEDLVEQACWWEGTTAQAVFEAMEELAPDHFWAVWEPDSPGGKPRFEYLSWYQEPRYLIPLGAGTLRLEGGLDEVYNRCVVAYKNSGGVTATTVVTGHVPELTAAGEQRTLPLDLTSEGPMSLSTATRRGTAAMSKADVRRTSGTATITAPVFDRKWARMVEPWEIRPGHAIVWGDVVPRADSGNTYSQTGVRDGRSTFRLTGTTWSASTGACELTLDGGGRTIWRRLRQPAPR